MNKMTNVNRPMLISNPDFFNVIITESCGITHEKQILEIDIPEQANLPETFIALNDDKEYVIQRSKVNRSKAFLQISIEPFENINLQLSEKISSIKSSVNCEIDNDIAEISNEDFGLYKAAKLNGAILECKTTHGEWRVKNFIDTREQVYSYSGTILEDGPLRIVYRYSVEFSKNKYYNAVITIDAGMQFAVISEEFSAGIGDQVVWDFSGDDIPDELYLLDSTPLFSTTPLSYFYDSRIARLAMWTQYSQLKDFSDGFAFRINNTNDVIGVDYT